MTNLVSEKHSDVFFGAFEYFATAKEKGALVGDELSKLEMQLGTIFANQVRRGLKTEEQAEEFLAQVPNGTWGAFNHSHKDQDVAYKTMEQDINAALYEREKLQQQSRPVKRM